MAAAATVTVPVPLPSAGDTVRPALLLAAVQPAGAHPAGEAATVTVCDPPSAANAADAGERENVEGTTVVTG